MATATTATKTPPAPASKPGGSSRGWRRRERPNWAGALFGLLWLFIVLLPAYWVVITSFKSQANYYATNPLQPPTSPTLANYRLVLENNFVQFFLNSVIVAFGTLVPAVLASFMAAYAIVRSRAR